MTNRDDFVKRINSGVRQEFSLTGNVWLILKLDTYKEMAPLNIYFAYPNYDPLNEIAVYITFENKEPALHDEKYMNPK